MWVDRLVHYADTLQASVKPYRHIPPQQTTESDLESWEVAVEARKVPKNREDILAILNMKNPWRMRRLHRDFRWVQRKIKKMGLNPEDARWLL